LTDEQRPFGASTAIYSQGKWLLGLRSNEPWRGCWSLPGGRLEADESPAQAAARELKEEISLDVAADDLLAFHMRDLGENRLLSVHLLVLDQPPGLMPGDDCAGLVWLPKSAIEMMPDSAKTPKLDDVLAQAEKALAKL
jgi:ADP-ribose pyrophosphatase YjhB (NUDIX family)